MDSLSTTYTENLGKTITSLQSLVVVQIIMVLIDPDLLAENSRVFVQYPENRGDPHVADTKQ